MKYLPVVIIFSLFVSCHRPADKKTETGWVQLFNGRDLSGWKVKFSGYPVGVRHKHTFSVEHGILKVSYEEYDKFDGAFGHLFYDKKFSSYKLRAEYRFVGKQVPGGPSWGFMNNGLMIHSQSPESMLLDQDFPVAVECQLLGGNDTLQQPTGNVCTPGTNVTINGEVITRHCTPSSSPSFPDSVWVTIEVVVYGDSIVHHIVNGDTVMTYTHPVIGGDMIPEGFSLAPGTPLKEGYISIQAETAPTEFRKIEILDLDKK